MIQRISKRFLSLLLVAVMVLALLPVITLPAFAATSGTVTGLADENIGLSFEGDADDAWSANGTSITGAVTSTGGTCGDTPHKSTLTITNITTLRVIALWFVTAATMSPSPTALCRAQPIRSVRTAKW